MVRCEFSEFSGYDHYSVVLFMYDDSDYQLTSGNWGVFCFAPVYDPSSCTEVKL